MTVRAGSDQTHYRRILATTSIIGGATVLTVVLGAARMKVAALVLGPSGVGAIGLLASIMSSATLIAQFGLPAVGPRQIAEAQASGSPREIAVAASALVAAAAALGLAGAGALYFARDVIGGSLSSDPAVASALPLLAAGLLFGVLGNALLSILRGLGRMGDLARASIAASLVTTAVGVPLLWLFGAAAIPVFVALTPVGVFAAAAIVLTLRSRTVLGRLSLAECRPHWLMILRLGAPVLAAGLLGALVDVWLRIDVRRQLGPVDLGLFQASWTLAEQYIGVIVVAMAADYYPRLTAVWGNPSAATDLVNQQTEVSILLAMPLILGLFAGAPYLLHLLFSAEFALASEMLRWQAVATGLKVVSWPLGYVLLARGAGPVYLAVESLALIALAGFSHLLMPAFGLKGVGIAYLLSACVYLPIVYVLARRWIGFSWTRPVILAVSLLVALLGLSIGGLSLPAPLNLLSSVACILLGACYGLWRLTSLGLLKADWGRQKRHDATRGQ